MFANGREFKNHVFEQFARIGKAMSSPARLELLDILCQGERTVEVLAKEASLTVGNTSRHLQVLLGARLVKTRKEGVFITYQLADEAVCKLWKSMQDLGESRLTELNHAVNSFFNVQDEMEGINRKSLLNRVRKGEVVVLDVRPIEEYNAGHLKGAISIPIKELQKRLKELPKDKEIVAYCRGPYCVLSHTAVGLLSKQGYKAYRMREGIQELKKQRYSIQKGVKAA